MDMLEEKSPIECCYFPVHSFAVDFVSMAGSLSNFVHLYVVVLMLPRVRLSQVIHILARSTTFATGRTRECGFA